MSEWYEIRARFGSRDLWVERVCPDEPLAGEPWVTPDGRAVWDLLIEDRVDEVPYPIWYRPDPRHRGKRRGDMLWTTGTTKIASTAMVEVLTRIGATGWSAFEVDLRERDGTPVPGYVGLSVHSNDPEDDLVQLFGGHDFTFLAAPRVVAALREAGVTDLVIDAFRESDYDGL